MSEDAARAVLREWADPPPMDPAAPAPALLSSDGTLWLAYRIARDPHHSAVLRFHQVERYAWGPPPAVHQLDEPGPLPQGGFYQVRAEAGAERRDRGRRWLITFPDATLEVRAAEAEVVLRAAAALGPAHALAALLA